MNLALLGLLSMALCRAARCVRVINFDGTNGFYGDRLSVTPSQKKAAVGSDRVTNLVGTYGNDSDRLSVKPT